jgi:hypothetical protein
MVQGQISRSAPAISAEWVVDIDRIWLLGPRVHLLTGVWRAGSSLRPVRPSLWIPLDSGASLHQLCKSIQLRYQYDVTAKR